MTKKQHDKINNDVNKLLNGKKIKIIDKEKLEQINNQG